MEKLLEYVKNKYKVIEYKRYFLVEDCVRVYKYSRNIRFLTKENHCVNSYSVFTDELKNYIDSFILTKEFKYDWSHVFNLEINAEDYHWNNNLNKQSEDHLYFLIHDDTIKIGRSLNVEKRINQLKTGLSKSFKYYSISNKGFMENTLHNCFSEFRLNGEWFVVNERLVKFINKYSGDSCDISLESFKQSEIIIEEYKLKFGKYKGYSIKEISNIDNSYLNWLSKLSDNPLPKKVLNQLKSYLLG